MLNKGFVLYVQWLLHILMPTELARIDQNIISNGIHLYHRISSTLGHFTDSRIKLFLKDKLKNSRSLALNNLIKKNISCYGYDITTETRIRKEKHITYYVF